MNLAVRALIMKKILITVLKTVMMMMMMMMMSAMRYMYGMIMLSTSGT